MRLSEVNLASRENNLNLIRLIAATSVAFAHSFALLEGKSVPIWNGCVDSGMFGFVAVGVFFGLSGFLITQSFDRQRSWFHFLEARWLRIFPGLFFSCLVTTVLVSQFIKHQGFGAFLDLNNWRYTFGAFFFDYNYFDGVFDMNPTHGVNGSLWTLPIEFRMYLFVLAMGVCGLLARPYSFLVFSLTLLVGKAMHLEIVTDHIFPILFRIKNDHFSYYSLPFCFVSGMLVYLFRQHVRLNPWWAAAGLIGNIFVHHWAYTCVSFVYAAFALGYSPRAYLPRLNFKADLSYGTYVLSFPIQQTLIYNGWKFEPHFFFLLTMACTLPLALISWHFFEKPALKWKGKIRRRPTNPQAASSLLQKA